MRCINFLIKPASSLCNLRCRYCFYEDIAENRACKSMGVMTAETAELLLTEAYGMLDGEGAVSFAFQGGEPTMAGLEFFRNFCGRARALAPAGAQVSFSIQTNGTLLNEEWAELFAREDFLVGVSLDGFKDLHNAHRVDAQGNDTWNRVIKNVRLLQKHKVRVNALCVVTGQCARSPEKTYHELKKLGFEYIQYIACLDPMGVKRGTMPFSLTPEAYGKFLCRVFDLWYDDWAQGKYTSVRLFDDYIHLLLGDGGGTCATCGQCGGYLVSEGDGTMYPCDFYVLDEWRLGKLGEQKLADMAAGPKMREFLDLGKDKPPECGQCPDQRLCNGGCKNDWYTDEAGNNHNYFCKSFRMLFDHGMDRMVRIARSEYALRCRLERHR